MRLHEEVKRAKLKKKGIQDNEIRYKIHDNILKYYVIMVYFQKE